MSRALRFGLVLPFALLAAPLHAQTTDRALAETLFAEAKRLKAQGKLDEACPRFDDSYRAYPGTGALLNAAACFEAAGKTATAWARYGEAAAAAKRDGSEERVRFAEGKRSSLEPKLSRLKVDVAASVKALPGLTVTIAGRAIPPSAFGLAVPVDPGLVVVEVSAPDHQAYRDDRRVAEGKTDTINIEKLEVVPAKTVAGAASPPPPSGEARTPHEDAGQSPASAPPSADVPRSGNGQRIAGYAIGGVGLAGVGVGIAFNMLARSANDDAKKDCLPISASGGCVVATDPQKAERETNLSDARRNATISYVTLGVGAAALATGIVLVVSAKSGASERATLLVPTWSPGHLGLTLTGAL